MAYRSKIPATIKQIETNGERALEVIGIFVKGEAQTRAAVDEGNLRDSIEHEVIGSSVFIGTNIEYGLYVEFGTGKYASNGGGRTTPWVYKGKDGFYWTEGQKPQPYLTPAFEDNRSRIKKIASKELGRGL